MWASDFLLLPFYCTGFILRHGVWNGPQLTLRVSLRENGSQSTSDSVGMQFAYHSDMGMYKEGLRNGLNGNELISVVDDVRR